MIEILYYQIDGEKGLHWVNKIMSKKLIDKYLWQLENQYNKTVYLAKKDLTKKNKKT